MTIIKASVALARSFDVTEPPPVEEKVAQGYGAGLDGVDTAVSAQIGPNLVIKLHHKRTGHKSTLELMHQDHHPTNHGPEQKEHHKENLIDRFDHLGDLVLGRGHELGLTAVGLSQIANRCQEKGHVIETRDEFDGGKIEKDIKNGGGRNGQVECRHEAECTLQQQQEDRRQPFAVRGPHKGIPKPAIVVVIVVVVVLFAPKPFIEEFEGNDHVVLGPHGHAECEELGVGH